MNVSFLNSSGVVWTENIADPFPERNLRLQIPQSQWKQGLNLLAFMCICLRDLGNPQAVQNRPIAE